MLAAGIVLIPRTTYLHLHTKGASQRGPLSFVIEAVKQGKSWVLK